MYADLSLENHALKDLLEKNNYAHTTMWSDNALKNPGFK